jgi:hypothetical protein
MARFKVGAAVISAGARVLLIVSDTEKLAREAGTEDEPPPRRPLI